MPEIFNTAAAVVARLRGWAEANQWSKSRFAVEAGLVDTTLRGFDKADWNPTRETLEKLEAVLPPGWQIGDPVPTALPRKPAASSGKARAA